MPLKKNYNYKVKVKAKVKAKVKVKVKLKVSFECWCQGWWALILVSKQQECQQKS